jgi:hypothetical protein
MIGNTFRSDPPPEAPTHALLPASAGYVLGNGWRQIFAGPSAEIIRDRIDLIPFGMSGQLVTPRGQAEIGAMLVVCPVGVIAEIISSVKYSANKLGLTDALSAAIDGADVAMREFMKRLAENGG